MHILGLSTHAHDTGVALLQDGRIIAVLEEERHCREKHTAAFPARSLATLLAGAGVTHPLRLSDIDVITVPWGAERLRRTFTAAVLGRLPVSLDLLWDAARPTQDGDRVVIDVMLRQGLRRSCPG